MDDIAERIHSSYGMRCDALREFRTGFSAVTLEFESQGASWVAKLTPGEDASNLIDVLHLQKHISSCGVAVPHPVATTSGALLDTFGHNGRKYVIYVYRKLAGKNAEDNIRDHIQRGRLHDLGRDVGLLHQAMQSCDRDLLPAIATWHQRACLFTLDSDKNPAVDPDILAKHEEVQRDIIATQGKCDEVIHSDLHLANVLFDDNEDKFRFIDLDDVLLGTVQMDLATLIFDLPVLIRKEEIAANIQQITIDILDGYHSTRHLTRKQVLELPQYLKLLEIVCYINFLEHEQSGDQWIRSFYAGRKENILGDVPYADLDIDRVLEQLVLSAS